jgi:hypothetical protein
LIEAGTVGLGSRISRGVTVWLAAVFFALLASACTPAASRPPDSSEAWRPPDGSRFSARVDHPLVPLASVPVTFFEGTERRFLVFRSEVRVESRVLERTDSVAGVPVAVVDVKEYKDGQLVEHTLDYYAQDKEGNVWYLGERVDDIADGKVVGHRGEWLAGQDGARPGLFMPAHPEVGQTFQQERAPGVAEDRSTVVAVGLEVRTPLRTFSDCIKTKDVAPLDRVSEFKHYCPGVGLVREEGVGERLELVHYR